jgi:alkylation response protein AidB-like acyl-CoA dehydrogenase
VTQDPDPIVADERAYRDRAQRWVAEHLTRIAPTSDSWGTREGESELEWVARSRVIAARLYEGGYNGITIAKEWGGQGLTGRHHQIFEEAAAGYERPGWFAGDGGPIVATLLAELADDQKRVRIPALLRGDELWCQLMSEPGAGSDLAGITTRAERDGDEWVINGQKVWSTGAHFCDYAICLARTDWDVPKYNGLSVFCVPLRHVGVTVRPLRQLTGSAPFCEVFLDDVRIPVENIVGEPNGGWSVMQGWLTYEHGGMAKGDARRGQMATRSLAELAMPTDLVALATHRGALDDPAVRSLVAEQFVARGVQGLLGRRMGNAMRTGAMPGHAGSLVRYSGVENQQHNGEAALNLAGPASVAWDPGDDEARRRVEAFLEDRALTIRGGTKEIQRNMVGERVLGLPREPAVDRGIPFRDVRTNASPPRAD